MKTKILISFLFCTLTVLTILGNCATRTEFVYEHPEIQPQSLRGLIVGFFSIEDQREDSKEMDKVYGDFPVGSLNQILEEEMESTGLFEQVLILPEKQSDEEDYLNHTGINFVVQPGLLEMKWEVPDYETKMKKIGGASFFFGLMGGMAYGSKITEVWGKTTLHIILTDANTGELVLNKNYEGFYVEEMKILECDTRSTKAYIVGKSFKQAMEEYKQDLIKTFE
jgi:hypothetical protein